MNWQNEQGAGRASPAFKEKLVRALSGPVAPPSEQPKNSMGRNTMFELFLAADWRNHGLSVEPGEPDICLKLAGRSFLVECKRPFYENTVWPNIEDAASQSGKELDKPENINARGIIAISLSRVFTQNDLMCFADEEEGKRFITNEFHSLIARHEEEWRLKHFLSFHSRIVAVMFHLAVPWDIGGERLVHATRTHFVPAGSDMQGRQLLMKSLYGLYS
jgi:hypothetical protein